MNKIEVYSVVYRCWLVLVVPDEVKPVDAPYDIVMCEYAPEIRSDIRIYPRPNIFYKHKPKRKNNG